MWMVVIHWVCAIVIRGKFPNSVPQLLQGDLSMEQQCCGTTQISIDPEKVQHLEQCLMKPGHLEKHLLARHRTFFKLWGRSVHEHKGCTEILSTFKVNGSLLLCTIFWYCIIVYEHIKDTNKPLISKAVLLTCKHWQKFQLNCAYLWFYDMKQTASWNSPTVTQNVMLNQCLKTVHH